MPVALARALALAALVLTGTGCGARIAVPRPGGAGTYWPLRIDTAHAERTTVSLLRPEFPGDAVARHRCGSRAATRC